MAYVRQHGRQVEIVHGERDGVTGKVQQRVLFTFYSKAEVDAALGDRPTEPPFSLHRLLEARNEGIRIDWPKLEAKLRSLRDELPDTYDYPASGAASKLREGVVAFTRALLTVDPQALVANARAIEAQRLELEFLSELIGWRIMLCDRQAEHPFNRDNEFGWLARTAGGVVPPEAEELMDGMRQRGEDDRVEAVAGVLVEAWPDYADGYNKLGNAALARGEYDRALELYHQAMVVGRKLFPKRIAKSRWWTDLDTRPYIRAMRNTALTLLWSEKYEEVLPWCDRLAQECFDEDTAALYRAHAWLNLGRWSEARQTAGRYVALWPSENFVAAFAAYELGDLEDALARWLHAAIQHPRAARMLTGGRTRSRPEGYEEVEDHNAGVTLHRALSAYLRRKPAQRFFSKLIATPEIVALQEEYAEAVRAWGAERGTGERTGYRKMMEMRTPEFAARRAEDLRHLVGTGPRR